MKWGVWYWLVFAMAVFFVWKNVHIKAEQIVLHSNEFGKEVSHDVQNNHGMSIRKVVIYPYENADKNHMLEQRGILIIHPGAKATIIICHGFMCDMVDTGFLRTLFTPKKYNFLTFNFRAHGQSAGEQECTFGQNEALDVSAAAQFVRHHPALHEKPLFVYGFSMGSVAAIEAQSQDCTLFDAMILDCPFDSSEAVLKHNIDRIKFSICGYEFGMPGKGILQKYAFNPYVQTFLKAALKTVVHLDAKNIPINICPFYPFESIRSVTVPCFFIHCRHDEKVPVDSVLNVFENAQGHKELWITAGRRHFDSFFYNPEEYIRRINQFFDSILDGSYCDTKVQRSVREDSIEIMRDINN